VQALSIINKPEKGAVITEIFNLKAKNNLVYYSFNRSDPEDI